MLTFLPRFAESHFPSCEKTMENTRPPPAWKVRTRRKVETSHRFNGLSKLAVAMKRPSGETATMGRSAESKARVRTTSVDTSQSLIVLSRLAEAIQRPSGEKATELTSSLCP